MKLLEQLERRGMIEQVTNRAALDELLEQPKQAIYIGFDPTADSLHVGHLLPALMLSRFQRAGHRPIVLVGGATGMIGDPSGRSTERQLLNPETIQANSDAVKKQLARFVDFTGDTAAIMVNNADWTAPVSYLDFLRDIGKHFTVNYMLAKESVRRRLEDREHGISYTEFSYMLLQAFDFLHLHGTYGCAIQAGGSDQWGNITAGIELIRRMCGAEAFGITFPLLATSSGEKFGKSAGNAVWLDPGRTSPYQFYQYWIRTDDRDVERFLKLFTFLSDKEIAELCAQPPDQRAAHKRLAAEVTRIVHGEENLALALKASEVLFGGEVSGLRDRDLADIFADVPSFSIDRAALASGIKMTDALVASGAAKSKGDATRLIAGGGVYMNNQRVAAADAQIHSTDLASESMLVLRVGKKSYFLGKAG
ncbi:MAG TPA: tyrosine--tRNA ligase [Bryobacteraceae bacterium]|nr:tyrosine--tRNA ligase [Bryobacteraceae bacterium]